MNFGNLYLKNDSFFIKFLTKASFEKIYGYMQKTQTPMASTGTVPTPQVQASLDLAVDLTEIEGVELPIEEEVEGVELLVEEEVER